MTIESCHYTLKMRGRSIGSQVVRSQENRRIVYLESKLTLQGSIDEKIVKQSSRLYRPDFHSLYFREENQDKSHKRSYEVRFDKGEGLVKVFKDGGDNASAPYLLPYQDPLGLLYQLRFIPADQDHVRVPMLGRDVTVRQLPEVELELAGDLKIARVFELHPGGSLVYIDSEAPHNILKLNQRIGQQVIEAELESFSEEDGYLNDDIRQSNRRNRSNRSNRSGRGGNRKSNRGGRARSRNRGDKDKNSSASTRGQGRSSNRSDSRSDSRSDKHVDKRSDSRSKSTNKTDSTDSKNSSSSKNTNRSKRSRPPKSARSRRDSYQRSHKQNKAKSDSKDKAKDSE